MSKIAILLTLALLSARIAASPVFEVRNTEGKSLVIELLALEDSDVVFSIATDKSREHTLPLDKFDATSQEKIREQAKDLKPRVPKLGIEVVVGRRRVKDGYYMVIQTVTAKVKLRNLSTKVPFPKSKGHLTYIGRNRRYPDQYQILAKRTFNCEIPANQLFEQELLGVKTRYDSDNKGSGNIGGYQYDGYLLVITDDAGNILATKTSDAGISKALEQDTSVATKLIGYPDKTVLDKNFEKLDPRQAL